MKLSARWLIPTLLVTVAGCVSTPQRAPVQGVGAPIGEVPTTWSFDGRLAVTNGKDSGSGRIHWEQDGEFFTITLRAPISGQGWKLSGDDSHARLEGVRSDPVLGRSAQELLRRELGWELPVGDMRSWLFGKGFGARARIAVDASEMPETVVESGWNIGYKGWRQVAGIPVPGRIIARKPPFQVRLAIQRWTFPPSDVADAANH